MKVFKFLGEIVIYKTRIFVQCVKAHLQGFCTWQYLWTSYPTIFNNARCPIWCCSWGSKPPWEMGKVKIGAGNSMIPLFLTKNVNRKQADVFHLKHNYSSEEGCKCWNASVWSCLTWCRLQKRSWQVSGVAGSYVNLLLKWNCTFKYNSCNSQKKCKG